MGAGMELGKAFLDVRARFDNLKGDLDKAGDQARQSLNTTAGKMQSVGGTLTKTLTPAAVAVGAAFNLAFKEFDSGSDIIIAKTGATGETLKGLEGVMKSVAGQTTSGFADIGKTIGDLNTMLGLTGKPLEEVTRQITKLHDIGQPVDAQSFARFMSDWAIKNEDASASLDKLYTISQKTGQPVNDLLQLIVQFGAPLRSLGFDVETSQLMLAKWHKEGVNVETLLAGMKMGLGKIAKGMGDAQSAAIDLEKAQVKYNAAVKEHGAKSLQAREAQLGLAEAQATVKNGAASIPAAFDKTIKAIQGAKTESEAFTIAIEAFGKRAGPDFAKAVLEGRFNLEDLKRATADSTGSINAAHEGTLDWSDKLIMLKNKVIGVIGPVGEYGLAIGGIAAGIGPAIGALGKIVGHFTKSGAAAAAAMAPTVAHGAASAAAGGMAATGSVGFMAMAAGIWATLAPILAVIAIIAVLIAAGWLLFRNWETIVGAIGGAMSWLADHWRGIVQIILGVVLGPLGLVIGYIINNFDKVKGAVGGVFDWITDRIGGFVNFVSGIPDAIGNALSGAFNGLVSGFRWAWNHIARLVNGIDFTIPSWVPGLGGKTFGLPDLPMLAKGGNIEQAGLSIVGDAGPEALWLPRGAQVSPLGTGGRMGGDIIIRVEGSVVSERKIYEIVADAVDRRKGRLL